MKLNEICWLTCTYGRVRCLERNVRCFLDQDYEGMSYMVICNSGEDLILDFFLLNSLVEIKNKKIFIVNCKDNQFKSVGEKYNYALRVILKKYPMVDVITSADDDDIFLPNHLTEGNKGINRAESLKMEAYKPKYSYFRHKEGGMVKVIKNENTYEPSIFVKASWVREKGFENVSIKYHQRWLNPLVESGKILVDPNGESTLIYNWADDWDIYKMSGSAYDNQNNFDAHKRQSVDMGDGFLRAGLDNSKYYKEVKESNLLS